MKNKFKVGDTIRILDTPNVRWFEAHNNVKSVNEVIILKEDIIIDKAPYLICGNKYQTNFQLDDFELVNQQISFNYLIF